MIVGIGNDLIEVTRIAKALKQNPRFMLKNFTCKEQEYFQRRNNSYETIAGNFAAKEAVSKALGTGFRGFGLIDVEVIRNDQGGPIVLLYGGAKKIAEQKKIENIWVSISHSQEYATAMAVAERACK